MDVGLTWFELLRNAIDALKANAPVASVVIAVLAFLVSLATYRRAWRWRSEAEPVMANADDDKTRCQSIISPPTELAQGARQMRH